MSNKKWLLSGKRIEGTRETADRLYVRFRDRRREPNEKAVPLDKSLFDNRTELAERVRDLRREQAHGEIDVWADELTGTGHLHATAARGEEAPVDAIASSPLLLHVERYCTAKREAGKRGERGGWKKTTYQKNVATLRAFAELAGPERPIAELRTSDLAAYVHAPLRSGSSAGEEPRRATKDFRWRTLRTFLAYLHDGGILGREITMPPAVQLHRRVRDYLTEEEMERVVEVHELRIVRSTQKRHVPKRGTHTPASRRWQQEAIRLAFYQGMRRDEVVHMRWAWIDWQQSLLTIGDKHFRPKSGRDRTIPITPPALAVLRRHYRNACTPDVQPHPQTYVFCPSSSYRPILAARLSKAFREARREAFPEKADVDFHALRRSGSIYLQKVGLSESDVADILGHADVKITRQHYDEVDASAMQGRMRSAFGGST